MAAASSRLPNHEHTALVVSSTGQTKVISHGSEKGPFLLDLLDPRADPR